MTKSPQTPPTQPESALANTLARGVVRSMVACRPLERVLLPLIRAARTVQPFKALWWRLRDEYGRQTRGTERELRWIAVPHTRARLLVPVNSDFGCFFFENKRYEAATTDAVARLLSPGDVFVDVGANIGYFTVMAAARVGSQGRVYAFEPNPLPRRLLEISIAKNGLESRVTLRTCALSDTDGEDVEFFVGSDLSNSTISSLAPWEGHLQSGTLSREQSIRVPSRTFDSVADELAVAHIDVVKIDVEGAEMLVLNGMRRSLERCRPRHVVCETGLHSDIAALLIDSGYRAEPIQFLNPEAEWGNILFTRW